MILPVQFIAPTFAEGYCPPTLQQFANDYAAGLQLTSPLSLDTVIVSDTAPADHNKLWFKTLAGAPFTYPSIPLYKWHTVFATWVAAHYRIPGAHDWEEFTQESDIWSFEGGDGSDPGTVAPTATTGSFWEVDPAYNGRSPMSPGSITGANPVKSLGYGEDFGSGAQVATSQQVAPHTHPFVTDAAILNGDNLKTVTSGVGAAGVMIGLSGPPYTADIAIGPNAFTSAQEAMPVIHPVRGMSCIRRTGRLYYVG